VRPVTAQVLFTVSYLLVLLGHSGLYGSIRSGWGGLDWPGSLIACASIALPVSSRRRRDGVTSNAVRTRVGTLNRAISGAPADGVRAIQVDRRAPKALASALGDGEWDAVIDTWSGALAVVQDSAGLLRDRVGRYGYVSSRSVYRWPLPPGIDENALWWTRPQQCRATRLRGSQARRRARGTGVVPRSRVAGAGGSDPGAIRARRPPALVAEAGEPWRSGARTRPGRAQAPVHRCPGSRGVDARRRRTGAVGDL
jgi:hypothetical protein